MLKPYWFLEGTLDVEYKYLILMGYLMKVKEHFNEKGFEKYFKSLLTMKKDLMCFIKDMELSQRTLGKMAEAESEEFYNLLEKNLDSIGCIEEIAKNSIQAIDDFLEKNEEISKKYNSLVCIESYSPEYNYWDQGFLIIRKKRGRFMRIFNWFFSIIKIGDKESVALLMTEFLDPRCPTTHELSEIKGFLKQNSQNFSELHDCILICDVSKDVDIEIGTEIGKEKSIEIIMGNLRNQV